MSILSVPLKTILLWHADLQNETPPSDYGICDGRTLTSGQQDINPGGTYVLPDLRHAFLVGADLTKAAGTAAAVPTSGNINVAAGAPGPKGTGGSNGVALSTAELAAHNHAISDPGHTHGAAHGSFVTMDSNQGSNVTNTLTGGGSDDRNQGTSNSGTGITINNSGSGNAHESRPKFYGVVYIMKVKI